MFLEQTASDGLDHWYSLFVKTGAEHDIQEKIKNLKLYSLQFHIPSREMRIRRGGRWHIEISPMFPGYILVNGQLSADSYTKIKQISDVYTWISDENGPLQIAPWEIALLNRLLDKEDIIRMSKVFYEGDRIVVLDGPLVGNEAIIRKVDRRKGRVKVVLSMFDNERLVDISVENIAIDQNGSE